MLWVFGLQFRQSIFRFVAPAVSLAAAVLAWNAVFISIATQANIANVLLSTVAVLSPVLAGFAAWDGLRDTRHGGAPILKVAVQPRSRVLITQVLAGLCYTLGIYLTLIGVLYFRVLVFGLSLAGAPYWVNLTVPLLALWLFIVLAYVLASLIGHWVAVILAATVPLVVYWFALFGSGFGLLYDLAPFGNRAGGDFLDPNFAFFFGQALFILGLVAMTLSLMALWARQDRAIGLISCVIATALIASGTVLVSNQDRRWGNVVDNPEERLSAFHSNDGRLTLFLLPEYEPVSEELLARWSRVQEITADSSLAFEELKHLREEHPEPLPDGADFDVIYLNPASSQIASDSVLETIFDVHSSSCLTDTSFEILLVDLWLAGEGSESNAVLSLVHQQQLERLRDLDDEASRDWFTSNSEAWVHCSLTPEDLP